MSTLVWTLPIALIMLGVVGYAVYKYRVQRFYESCVYHTGPDKPVVCERCGKVLMPFSGHHCKGVE